MRFEETYCQRRPKCGNRCPDAVRAENPREPRFLRPKKFLVSVDVGRLVRHRARVGAAAAAGAVILLTAGMRVLALLGLLLAAIHRPRFTAAFLVAAGLGGTRITVLGGAKADRRCRNRQTSATNNCDYEGLHSSH